MPESDTARHTGTVVADVRRYESLLFHLLLLERVVVAAVLLPAIALASGTGRSFWITLVSGPPSIWSRTSEGPASFEGERTKSGPG